MKKIIFIISLMFLITGCTNINELSYDEIIQEFSTKPLKSNNYRTGYKYYLPREMQVVDSTLFNEVLEDGQNTYYLYVDTVSYLNNVSYDFKNDEMNIYFANIAYDDKYGYVEINLYENEQYLVEIMYNYAKIEVIVDEKYINKALLSAINILKSIEYNDSIITNLLEEDVLNFAEEEFNIFENTNNDDNYVEFSDDSYESNEQEIPDTDLIN